MATRVTDGARRERHEAAALVSRVSRLRRFRARALLSLKLKKKRDCSRSTALLSSIRAQAREQKYKSRGIPCPSPSLTYCDFACATFKFLRTSGNRPYLKNSPLDTPVPVMHTGSAGNISNQMKPFNFFSRHNYFFQASVLLLLYFDLRLLL